jgi:hypothetical protein
MTIQQQIEHLDAVKRLRANRDFVDLVQSMLEHERDVAHAALLNPEVSGQKLEYARARYVATRGLANYLADKQAALETSITAKQAASGRNN